MSVDALKAVAEWNEHLIDAVEEDGRLVRHRRSTQDQVAARVVASVAPQLESAEMERVRHKPTESLDAYDHYLQALAAINRSQIGEARRCLTAALERQPDYAKAKALGSLGHYGQAEALATEVIQQARDARVGPLEALGLFTRGGQRERTGDDEGSEADLRQAVALAKRSGDPGTRALALTTLIYVVAKDPRRYEPRMRCSTMRPQSVEPFGQVSSGSCRPALPPIFDMSELPPI